MKNMFGAFVPPDYNAMLAAQKANPNIATDLAVANAHLQNLAQQRAAFKAANPGVEIPGDPDVDKKKEGMSKKKKILIIAGSAVGALGLGALAYFKFKKKGRK